MEKNKGFIIGCTITVLSLCLLANGQYGRSTIPDTVMSCYRNTTAYNRYTRLPMHIDQFISIIRKIESREPQWDMRRITRTLVHRFMFDGIEFTPSAKPEYQYNPSSKETVRTHIVKELIKIPVEELLPHGIIDNDEMCALHWMLSHSMNATVRPEEGNGIFPPPNNGGSYGGYPSYNGNGNSGNGNSYNSGGYPNNGGYNTNNGNNGGYNSGSYGGGRYDYGRRRRSIIDEEVSNSEENSAMEGETIENENQSVEGSTEDENNDNTPWNTEEDEQPKSEETDQGSETEEDTNNNSEEENVVKPGARSVNNGSKLAKQVSVNDPKKTRRPVETGVVYTKWGTVSLGKVILGIAAGLEPMEVPIQSGSPYPSGSGYNNGGYNTGYNNGGNSGYNNPGYDSSFNSGNNNGNPFSSGSNNNPGYQPQPYPSKSQFGRGRRKRQALPITFQPLNSVYAVTLAGDAGQAAIVNGIHTLPNIGVPSGQWNNSVCPREYILNPHYDPTKEIYEDESSWTTLTEAEIRGGVDGLILGLRIQNWNPTNNLKLSELLTMYYSEKGIVNEPQYRSCDRTSLFSSTVDVNKLREQSRSFGYYFNNHTMEIGNDQIESDPNAFISTLDSAYDKMTGVISTLSSLDPQCTRTSNPGNPDDSLKTVNLKTTVYAVLDHSVMAYQIEEQKEFFAQLAYEIDVSPTGSRMGLVDGSSGMILISPNWTDNKASLACNILSQPAQTKPVNIHTSLESIQRDIDRQRTEDERYNYESDRGVLVIYFAQGNKPDEGQKSSFYQKVKLLDTNYGDVKVTFMSNKFKKDDFNGFLLNPDSDFLRIEVSQNISQYADEIGTQLKSRAHSRLSYTKCNVNQYNQDEEHKVAQTFFISQNDLIYSKISPDYFYSARNLRIRFTSDNGRVRVCQSRAEQFPSSRNDGSNGVSCQETRGSYVTPGSSEIDVEFQYEKPCGKHGDRADCDPIYVSFSVVEQTPTNPGFDCSVEGCEHSSDVKVTFTHWDMRCNGALRGFLSPLSLIAVLVSIYSWMKFN